VITPLTIAYGWRLRLGLGGDPADDEYPDKPPRMRWASTIACWSNPRAADRVADERLRRVPTNPHIA